MNHQGALSIGVMLRDYDNTGGSLEHLELDGNEIGTGIQYIAQALKRNQNLRTLSLRQCKLDAKGCSLIGEALTWEITLLFAHKAWMALLLSNKRF
ncbi:hypothetical protein RMATCC62417_15394 [Rhizopus microsporus]|nr:hypothetical protein RMATCC62417_15394 [Rhizopus microsporus]